MTLETIKAKLIKENPILKRGSDESGYEEITGVEYDAIINQWANTLLAEQTAELEAAETKAALLNRLSITADEAKLLLS